MADLKLALAVFGISFLMGLQIHERYHYWVGKLFGAETEYTKRNLYVFVWETDFPNPRPLTPLQVRITSLVGYVSLTALIVIGLIPGHPGTITDFGLVGLFAGSSMISWLDGLGTQYPEQWKRFTRGGAISRQEFD